MAKSLRSKVKRSFRAKKRGEGVYAATQAARLQRLNAKLKNTIRKDAEGDVLIDDVQPEDDIPDAMIFNSTSSQTAKPEQISTHGPRGARREQWRLSKGLSARPTSKGMNRQGGIAARRRAGRSKRRR
ncbi:hypothetical protein FISHEDRAFT_65504 [Fistulina hepatica ATCC 64428]|nr:hypothetical protein FISHEDRAFT_65504 [Fistulina hepatica ATCC 64428]